MVLMVLRLNRTFTSGSSTQTLKARRIHTLECSNSLDGVKGDPQGSRKASPKGPTARGDITRLVSCSHS